ncbi:agrin-like [Schistocerca cancellata]|uniref:agrin-like n=1 Tax=Schistocerca cancellata TaxID=274614 RepID=UPI0021188599|nr:agrin-like [Schistocerca cancellata]
MCVAACDCSPLGSVREDCEQMTGRCACRPGVLGLKCTTCADAGHILTLAGCLTEAEVAVTSRPTESVSTTQTGEPLRQLAKTTEQLVIPVSQHQLPRPEVDSRITSASLQHDLSGDVTIHVTAASVEVRRLGSTCYADSDCALKNSLCHRGSCRCRNGLQPSHDGRRCLVYRIPAFDGESYIQLECLKAYNKLNIEMEFISYANDGLLLYNQQKEDGIGDFVSLAIIEGYVEFRYDLGNGAAVLRSANRITLGTVHHVSARRYHRDGLLRVDADPEVVGQSQGALRALDLQMDAFVGAVPTNLTRVSENVGAARGLVGCVQQLRLNQEEVRLHEGEPLVVRAVGVQECGANPCARLPCHNGGSCASTAAHSFRCHCPPEFTAYKTQPEVNVPRDGMSTYLPRSSSALSASKSNEFK